MVRAQMQSASFRRHSATMHAVARCANQLHQSRMNTQAGRPRWLLAWEMGSGMGHWAGLTAIASRAIAAGIEVVMVVPNLAPSGLAAPPGARVIACPPLVVHGNEAGGTSSMAELLARLRALLRRQRPQATNTVRVADLELDLISHHATRAGEKIELTRREFALLEFLMSASPKPVSKTAIVEHVWDQHFDSETNVVNVYIKHLRRKIERPEWKPLLHTVRGIGFAVREEAP